MEVIIRKLREKDGAGMITPVVAMLVALPFLVLLSNFIYIFSMAMNISDYVQEAVLQTATANAYNAYSGIREGNSSAHMYAGDEVWNEMVSTAELQTRLKEMLQMERQGNRLLKEKDGVLRYMISNINTKCTNVSVGAVGNSVKLTFTTTVMAEVPVSFLGVRITSRTPISLTSYYTPLF